MVQIIGHRGARGEKPENTIEAFRHAARLKIPIETDIAMTADFVPVMHHDPMLPDGRLICDLPFSALPHFIPTLADSLTMLADQDWLLEIKTYPLDPGHAHPPACIVGQVLKILDGTGIQQSRIAVKAFEWEVLREAARQRPALRRIALTAPETEAARQVWWGRGVTARTTADAVASVGAHAWSAFHEPLTGAQVSRAKSLGLQIFAWTVNEPRDFYRLAGMVDGIVTDYPSRFIDL